MWIKYQPNPCNRSTGDCSVRAIAKALKVDWETAYLINCKMGLSMCEMPSSDIVTSAVLRQNGFKRADIPGYMKNYTVKNFCEDNPVGTFVLYTGGHVVTVCDGNLYDIWNSSNETPLYVWYEDIKPVFYT